MTQLPSTYWMRMTEVLCPRCVTAGRHHLQPTYLHEITLNDGEQSVHVLFCFAKHCRFNEIRAQTGPGHEQLMTLRLQLTRVRAQLARERVGAACALGLFACIAMIVVTR